MNAEILFWIIAMAVTVGMSVGITALYVIYKIWTEETEEDKFDDDYYKTHCEGKEQ